jgi:hypothetical protein
VKTGWSKNLSGSSKESYGSKMAVVPIMMPLMKNTLVEV